MDPLFPIDCWSVDRTRSSLRADICSPHDFARGQLAGGAERMAVAKTT